MCDTTLRRLQVQQIQGIFFIRVCFPRKDHKFRPRCKCRCYIVREKGREGTRSLTRAAPSGGWNDAPTVLLAIIIISIIKDQTYSCILSSGGGVTDPEHEPGASERLQNAAAGVNGNSLSLNNVRTDSATHKNFPVPE